MVFNGAQWRHWIDIAQDSIADAGFYGRLLVLGVQTSLRVKPA